MVSVGSEQRPLPYFPLLSPSSTLSSDQQLPRAPFWLQKKQAQPSTARCSSLCSLLPWLLPVPLPRPCHGSGCNAFCRLLILLLFAREKAGVVSFGLSHCSAQDLLVAFIWEAAVSLSCAFEAFPHMASEDTLSLFNIFIL